MTDPDQPIHFSEELIRFARQTRYRMAEGLMDETIELDEDEEGAEELQKNLKRIYEKLAPGLAKAAGVSIDCAYNAIVNHAFLKHFEEREKSD